MDIENILSNNKELNDHINEKIKQFINDANVKQQAIKNAASLVKEAMYGPIKRNLLDAYTYVVNNNQIDFTYQEIKEYLFHNNDLI